MMVFGKKIPMMLSLLVWFAVWELVGRSEAIIILPPFTGVIQAAMTVLPTAKFQNAAIITLEGFLAGMGLAIAVGIPLGVLMGRIKSVDAIFGVWVNVFMSAPLTAVVPVLMVLFGFGQVTVILTVFLFAVWIIALDTQAGIKHINPSLLDMAHAFGATRVQLYVKVLVLAALPEILAGVRLGVIRGCKGVIVGQLLIAIIGMGELFELYSRNFLMEEFWVLIIVVFAFAFAVSELVAYVERRIEYYASSR
ncbi:MAG: ABC transporter permease [Acidiferrobacterales bacterium]